MSTLNETLENPLSFEELQQLNTLLTNRGGLTVFETQGFLCAMISGPTILPSQLWLTAIWGNEKEFHSMEEIKALANMIMRLNNQVADELLENDLFIPLVDYAPMAKFDSATLTDKQKQNLELWCRGYLLAVSLECEEWYSHGSKELGMLLLPIVVIARSQKFTFTDLGLDFKEKPSAEQAQQFFDSAIRMLPNIIPSIYDFWQEYLHFKETLPSFKIGRNDPCPCGSGKKFKKCCLSQSDTIH